MSQPKTAAKFDLQQKAIALLSDGCPKVSVAETLGIDRKTITRWEKDPNFSAELQAEINRRAERAKSELQAVADELQDDAIARLREDMKGFQETLVSLYKTRINHGLKLVKKAVARFDDLPPEAIAMKDIPAFVTAGDRLIEKGCEQWAEALGIEELLQKLDDANQ